MLLCLCIGSTALQECEKHLASYKRSAMRKAANLLREEEL